MLADPFFAFAVLFWNLGEIVGKMDSAFVIPVRENARKTADNLHRAGNNKKNQR